MSGSDTPSRRERVVRYGVDRSLSREQAAARISAYLYGNIIAFAALVPLSAEEVEHGHALKLVLGVAVSTYLAHVFSEIVGHQVRAGESMTRAEVWHEMVDSRPIASSAIVPCILIVAAMLDGLSGDAAVYAAEAYLLVRLALVGFIVERLRSERLSLRTLFAGVGLAAIAFGISVLKAALGH